MKLHPCIAESVTERLPISQAQTKQGKVNAKAPVHEEQPEGAVGTGRTPEPLTAPESLASSPFPPFPAPPTRSPEPPFFEPAVLLLGKLPDRGGVSRTLSNFDAPCCLPALAQGAGSEPVRTIFCLVSCGLRVDDDRLRCGFWVLLWAVFVGVASEWVF
jgi:hypothetical protein